MRPLLFLVNLLLTSALFAQGALADEVVYINLKDTGPGMSEDFIHDKLFEPFHSSKGVTGMGIGAFQAKSIVEKHGGQLLVESTVGEGTSFIIKYPLSEVG